jgi:hypothetical protein
VAARLIVEIIGDSSSLEKSFKRAAAAGGKFSGTISERAQQSVTASVKQRHELSQLAAEYTQVARAARQGSEEQVAALKLAADATRKLEAATAHSGRNSRLFGRDIEKAGHGALSATVGFAGLRRAAISTSAAFIGGVGVVSAIKSTIGAAEESQRVLGQTANAVNNSGSSWGDYGEKIRKAAEATAELSGFDDERLLGTFSQMVRRTHDVNDALRLNALAANVARGANIELEQASKIVLRASIGQARGLANIGVAARKGASGVELLDLLQRKFAGSAEAYGRTAVGAQERFGVALENTQEIIGSALLPSITKLLNKTTEWLNQPRNQTKIEATVKQTAAEAGRTASAFGKLVNAGRDVTGAITKMNNALGGNIDAYRRDEQALQKELDGLGKLTVAQKAVADQYGVIAAARARAVLAPLAPIDRPSLPQKFKGSGFGVGGAPPTPAQLRAIALAQFGGTGGPQEVAANTAQIAALGRALDFAKRQIAAGKGDVRKFADEEASLFSQIGSLTSRNASIAEDNASKAKAAAEKAAAARAAMIAALIPDSLHGSLSLPGLIEKLRNGLIPQSLSGSVKVGADTIQQAQFAALGLTPSGDERAPTVKALRALLGKTEDAVRGTVLDTKANKSLFAGIRHDLSSEFGKTTDLTKRKIEELLDALNPDTKQHGPLTDVVAVTGRKLSQQLAAGLGLTPGQVKMLRLNITGAHFAPGASAGAAISLTSHTHTRIDIDGRQAATAVTTHQARARGRNAAQTRGRVIP